MKYPRTPHVPWSNATKDDRILAHTHWGPNDEVVVTEKLDGENTTMTRWACHARSESSTGRVAYRHEVRALWGSLSNYIQESQAFIGECLTAQHSIHYNAIPGPYVMFGSRNETHFDSWEETQKLALALGIPLAPILYRGPWRLFKHEQCFSGRSVYDGEQEGYVIRSALEFPIADFTKHVAKFVRPNHVQTCQHWQHKQIKYNKKR